MRDPSGAIAGQSGARHAIAADFPDTTTLWFMSPTLSPRGDRVAYARIESDGAARLWISAVGGAAPIRATSDAGVGTSEFGGTWSPDGAWLAYTAATAGKRNLLKVRTSGEGAPVLLKTGLQDGFSMPEWSPAGEWIACGETLISPDAKTERPLGRHGPQYYTFSKDGRLLYGLRGEDDRQTLVAVDVATGAARVIGSGNTFEPLAPLVPSLRLSVAPDGKSLVYGAGERRSSLWLLEGFNPPSSFTTRLGWNR
jgi:WD40 repeat protein